MLLFFMQKQIICGLRKTALPSFYSHGIVFGKYAT